MVDKINFEALDRSDMQTAAVFVQSIGTVAGILCGADVSEKDMGDVLFVIANSLSVAGAVLYAGTEGEPLIKPLAESESLRKEIA